MKTYREFIHESYSSNYQVLYHGTYDEHDFEGNRRMTFFSTSKAESSTYGKFLYEIVLEPNLNIFDVSDMNDLKLLFKSFNELEDNYFNEDEEGYHITSPEQLQQHPDSWNAIEKTDGVLDWLEQYDGVWIFEGGVRNLMLFSPIKDKIRSIKKIR